MMTRRKALSYLGLLGSSVFLSWESYPTIPAASKKFRFCLNTSTISGCAQLNILEYIEIAGKAGYDGVELWVGDVEAYLNSGGSTDAVHKALEEYNVTVESAIGFAPWLSGEKGLKLMKKDMQMMGSIGCKRIAAPPVGNDTKPLDLFKTGEQYKKLLDLGRETGVMPQLEFWGASDIFWHLGQALMVVGVAGDTDARILPDIYHMFKGGSDFNSLEMINGDLIDLFHLNDYTNLKPREQQSDEDRVYPGDGEAPIEKVLHFLNKSEREKVLSLELFNKNYWQEDAMIVAKTGLEKMKNLVSKS